MLVILQHGKHYSPVKLFSFSSPHPPTTVSDEVQVCVNIILLCVCTSLKTSSPPTTVLLLFFFFFLSVWENKPKVPVCHRVCDS